MVDAMALESDKDCARDLATTRARGITSVHRQRNIVFKKNEKLY
jgi:hypothetical protein